MSNLCYLHNVLLPLIVYLTVQILCVEGSVGEIKLNLTIRLCSKDFCDLIRCVPFQECAGEVVKNGSVCGCCDSCVKILREGEECGNIVTPIGGKATSKCRTELRCNKNISPPICEKIVNADEKTPRCIKDKLKREALQKTYKGKTIDGALEFVQNLWMPDCDEKGFYKPLQCKKNKCFCVDPDGGRLFGQQEKTLATNMTCGCSLAMHNKKKEQGNRWMTGLREHCTKMGEFAELQCTDGICFCADPITGQATSRVVKPTHKDLLSKCYKSDDFEDGSYLSRCEEQAVRENRVTHTFARKGITIYRGDPINCDLDGSFSPRQCRTQVCHCTNRKGEFLGSHSMDTAGKNPATMNCRCARDINDNDQLGSQYPKLKCTGEGNFAVDQYVQDGPLWCTDEDGDTVAQSAKDEETSVTNLHDRCKAIIQCLEMDPECTKIVVPIVATTPNTT